MGNFIKTQNNFALGEVSTEFYATNNLRGVARLNNMDVLQSGALKRRPGLKKIANAAEGAIIVPFPISETEKYLLVITNLAIDVYSNDVKIASVVAPWSKNDLSKLQYAQRFNTLFFVHPDYQPRMLVKTSAGFNLTFFSFSVSGSSRCIPLMKFDDAQNISITITASIIDNNHATFTANADFWTNDSVNELLYVDGKQWIVESVQTARVATVYTNTTFSIPADPIYDWYEAAFSNKRGWPACVSFYQNRLVFAGTYLAPNTIWMSKVGDYYNFDAGTGLDDEAIYTSLLSTQHHHIITLVSSDKLQILTSVGEWAVSSNPLTPSTINVKQHTSVGSIKDVYLPPQQIEGSTVFVSGAGTDIRELDLDALGEHYNATDLCMFSKHLMNEPVSMSYNPSKHQLFIVMQNGYMAVLNKYSNADISAWGTYTTDGSFKYVCVFEDATYVIVKRESSYYLEKFDDSRLTDIDDKGFSYVVSGFPMIVNGHNPTKIRIRKISVRVINTKTIFVNGNRMDIPNFVYDDNSNGYSGDLSINILGTKSNTIEPLWTISSSEQLPTTILSVKTDGWYLI